MLCLRSHCPDGPSTTRYKNVHEALLIEAKQRKEPRNSPPGEPFNELSGELQNKARECRLQTTDIIENKARALHCLPVSMKYP